MVKTLLFFLMESVIVMWWCLDAGFNADNMWWRGDSGHPSNFNFPSVFFIYSGDEICNAGKWEVRHLYMSSSRIPQLI
ncbi:hypothetical protein QQP08_020423 [Theobroma cacao]|nr:hypothetical protein QQP08_020423 [Theobroma cacao]